MLLLKQNILDYYVVYNGKEVVLDVFIKKDINLIYNIDNIKYYIDNNNLFSFLLDNLINIYSDIYIDISLNYDNYILKLKEYGFIEKDIIQKLTGKEIRLKKEGKK